MPVIRESLQLFRLLKKRGHSVKLTDGKAYYYRPLTGKFLDVKWVDLQHGQVCLHDPDMSLSEGYIVLTLRRHRS